MASECQEIEYIIGGSNIRCYSFSSINKGSTIYESKSLYNYHYIDDFDQWMPRERVQNTIIYYGQHIYIISDRFCGLSKTGNFGSDDNINICFWTTSVFGRSGAYWLHFCSLIKILEDKSLKMRAILTSFLLCIKVH